MLAGQDQHRVLLVSSAETQLEEVFSLEEMNPWQPIRADSFARAMLVQQSNPCEILIVDQSIFEKEGMDGLIWLIRKQTTPMVFLADLSADIIGRVVQEGVQFWLPRGQSLQNPQILSGTLHQALLWFADKQACLRFRDSMEQYQSQVDRLVSLLWQTGQLETEKRWYSYRHMLERLSEEVNRAHRHGIPLTLVLGEMEIEADSEELDANLTTWAADRIFQHKRQSDAVGQYGMQGFMLLLSHTSPDGAKQCCQRLKTRLESREPAIRGPIKAFFGISEFTPENSSPQSLLRKAEERLLVARLGKDDGIVGE